MTRKERRRDTFRLCACAFLLTMIVCFAVLGLFLADAVTGRALHGETYTPPSMTAALPIEWLPPRLQVLWHLLVWGDNEAPESR